MVVERKLQKKGLNPKDYLCISKIERVTVILILAQIFNVVIWSSGCETNFIWYGKFSFCLRGWWFRGGKNIFNNFTFLSKINLFRKKKLWGGWVPHNPFQWKSAKIIHFFLPFPNQNFSSFALPRRTATPLLVWISSERLQISMMESYTIVGLYPYIYAKSCNQ